MLPLSGILVIVCVCVCVTNVIGLRALEQITVPLRGSAEILLYAGTPPSGEFEKTIHVGLKGGSMILL